MKTRFCDIPFAGEAIALLHGKVIWTNYISGDCPPDVAMMTVTNVYITDGIFIFELDDSEGGN